MNTDRTIPFEDMALPGDVQPATCDSYTPNTTGDYCDECGLEHREVMGDETK